MSREKIPIVALDESGAVVHWFESWNAAKRAGWNVGQIWSCIHGPLRCFKRHKGLTWRLASEVDPLLLPPPPPPPELSFRA